MQFVSASLVALSAMTMLELPHVNVLSKMDLIQVSTLSAHFSPVPPFMEAWLTRVAGTSGENTGAFGGKTDTYGGHAETFGGNVNTGGAKTGI